MQYRLLPDISTLARLYTVEQREEMLTGSRPNLLTAQEREFLQWWAEAMACGPRADAVPSSGLASARTPERRLAAAAESRADQTSPEAASAEAHTHWFELQFRLPATRLAPDAR